MAIIMQARNITKTFHVGGRELKALNNVSFAIEEGSLNVILGPSGAGKSTLLNILGGMDTPTYGSLEVEGQEIAGTSNAGLSKYRRDKVGFVFQFYNLMPNLTALENIELATELKRDAKNPREALASVGLSERENNFPSQLSGGEQQRVSIARAVAKNPTILLCDEPTGALDYETGKEILALLAKMAREEGRTVIIVTHNSALSRFGDRLIKLKNGEIVWNRAVPNPKAIEDISW